LAVPRTTLIAWALLLVPILVIALAFWPGRINIDTFGEIAEVATGKFSNRAAPLLLALWSPLWDLGVGTGGAFLIQVLTFVIGAYLVLRATFRPIGAAAVSGLVALSPPVFGNLGSLQRDTWFVALLLLTFGLVVRAAQRPWPARGWYLSFAVVAAWLTLATRQNAAAAAALACIAIVGLFLAHRRETPAAGREPDRASRWTGLMGAVAGGIALTLALMGTQVLGSRAIGAENVHPEAPLYIYDLAAISKRERENLFPASLMPQRGIGPIDRTYDVDSMLNFVVSPPPHTIGPQFSRAVGFPNVTGPVAASLRQSWWDAVTDHPGAYIGARWTLWLRQTGVTRNALSAYPPDTRGNGGNPFGFPGINRRAMGYLEAFTNPEASFYGHAGGDLLFTTWVYLLACLIAALVLLRRRRALPLVVVGVLALSALTYQVGLFVGALGTRFRFEYPCVVIGMLAAAVLLRLAWIRWRAQSADDAPDVGHVGRNPGRSGMSCLTAPGRRR
jgi:hypothetical protein